MNYLYLMIEILLVIGLSFVSYKIGKKEGLFIYIGIMASVLSIIVCSSIDILLFEVTMGLPIVMGIFMISNVIIHRYGLDELVKIIKVFCVSSVVTYILLALLSLTSNIELFSNSYNELFGYNLFNIRLVISEVISIALMLFINGQVYYYVRHNRNNFMICNIGSILSVQFILSMIYIIISYTGVNSLIEIFGMIVISYLCKVVIGLIYLYPASILTKMKE